MGYNYSTAIVSDNNDYKKVNTNDNNNEQNEIIYVLTVDNHIVSYDNTFNRIYDEARNIAKNISFKLLTKHGSSFLLSLEEDFDGEDSCKITLFSTTNNMLYAIRNPYCNISVLRVSKLGSEEYDYNNDKDLTNYDESSNDEDDTEEENDDNDDNDEVDNIDKVDDKKCEVYMYREIKKD